MCTALPIYCVKKKVETWNLKTSQKKRKFLRLRDSKASFWTQYMGQAVPTRTYSSWSPSPRPPQCPGTCRLLLSPCKIQRYESGFRIHNICLCPIQDPLQKIIYLLWSAPNPSLPCMVNAASYLSNASTGLKATVVVRHELKKLVGLPFFFLLYYTIKCYRTCTEFSGGGAGRA